MLNFLPERLKKSVKHEYYARVFLLLLIVICFLMIFSISAIIPTYTYSDSEKDRLANEVSVIDLETLNCTKDNVTCSDPTSQIKSINSLLKVLKDEDRVSISIPLLEILNNKNKSIKISSVKYLGEVSGQYQFSINGLSFDREGLLLFASDLKKDAHLSAINLPISDFVKSADIDFVLTVNVKK